MYQSVSALVHSRTRSSIVIHSPIQTYLKVASGSVIELHETHSFKQLTLSKPELIFTSWYSNVKWGNVQTIRFLLDYVNGL